jgi:hypothetical protein
MKDKPKSKWYWRVLRWGLIGLAIIATLAAVLVTEENWRGKHEWETFKQQSEARGEGLAIAAVIPPPVPDDENFFAAPIIAQALQAEWSQITNTAGGGKPEHNPLDFNIYRGNSSPTFSGDWRRAKATDLKPWQNYIREYNDSPEGKTNGFPVAAAPQSAGADVLLALSNFNPTVEALRQAGRRPQARLPLDYEQGFAVTGVLLPWLATEKRCIQLLELRSVAELDAGQNQAAWDDLTLLLKLDDALRNQPYLISQLVRLAVAQYALQPIYDGLAWHRWDDAQLASLETALAGEDFLADFQLAMRGERTCAIQSFENQRLTHQIKFYTEQDGQTVMSTNSLRWMPSAYFYQNELAFARLYEQAVLPLVDLTNRTVSVAGYHAADANNQAAMKHYGPYILQALALFPSVCKSVIKFAETQADVDLARVACALERYRLAHGGYPDSLGALAPQFISALPHDVIGGQPLHYRRTDDGKFVLYSVGWNEKDDGGTVVLTKTGTVDRQRGDWVWQGW